MKMKRYDQNSRNRKSIRLKEYDYSQSGLYFITICTRKKENILGEIKNGKMLLNECGQIAYDEWFELPKRFYIGKSDVFVVMPNHIHGIIQIVGGRAPARDAPTTTNGEMGVQDDNAIIGETGTRNDNAGVTTGNIVGAYKSLVANRCLHIYKSKNIIMGKLWQRNYYEHIIRNEKDYKQISEYILNNPINWQEDKYFI